MKKGGGRTYLRIWQGVFFADRHFSECKELGDFSPISAFCDYRVHVNFNIVHNVTIPNAVIDLI